MKKIVNIISLKRFYLLLVPLVIFLIGCSFAAYHILSYDTHFTVMPVVNTKDASLQVSKNRLYDGQILKGQFVASKDNLGSVALRVKNENDNAPDDYQIYFRIKEKGNTAWYSSNSYGGGQFHELDLFPFGFNLIADSQGKTYEFELFSEGATSETGPMLDQNQKIVTYYQLNKSDLKNLFFAMQYVIDKLIYIFNNLQGLFSALIYFLPLYAYYYLLAEKEKVILPTFISAILLVNIIRGYIIAPALLITNSIRQKLHSYHILDEYKPIRSISLLNILLLVTILIDVLMIQNINNTFLFIMLLLWGTTIAVYKIQLQSTFLIALGFLLMCFIFYVATLDTISEKAAIWSYLFLILGAFHGFISLRRANKLNKK